MKINEIYRMIGGVEELRALVDQFYDIMDGSTEAIEIRAMHPRSLKISREKLFMFLSGIFGGPGLYTEKYGQPRLRARHLPFPIAQKEKEQWMFCMKTAINKMNLERRIAAIMIEYFNTTAEHLINRKTGENPFNIRN